MASQQLMASYYGDQCEESYTTHGSSYYNNSPSYPQVSSAAAYSYHENKPKPKANYKYQDHQMTNGGGYASQQGKPVAYGGGACGGGVMSSGAMSSHLLPTSFPPGTDPEVVKVFQMVDQDRSGSIDDKELQRALSSYNQCFSLKTVHLLMYQHTLNPNTRKIGPKEFMSVYYCLKSWRETFERYDMDRSGKISSTELRNALMSLGLTVSPTILNFIISKYDQSEGSNKKKGLKYDHFIECCLTVKGLMERFKEKEVGCGTASFTFEEFMMTVLPFVIA